MASPLYKRDWESQFVAWSQPPGQTEQDRCDRAIGAVKKAFARSPLFATRATTTFVQGSYANRTNVRRDSDVDVGVLYTGTFHYDLPPGLSADQLGITPATYLYKQYKDEVERALVDYFGREYVTRGNKAFDVNENTYRVDADVVAVFEYRQYYLAQTGRIYYHSGTALKTDREGRLVTNFPQQQYDNGVAKNDETGRQFKKLVRIVKSLRNEMEDAGIAEARPMASFLLEGLVWNWPSELFCHSTWTATVTSFLAYIWRATATDAGCMLWNEVNDIKPLFGSHNEWTRLQVHAFAEAAYGYIESS